MEWRRWLPLVSGFGLAALCPIRGETASAHRPPAQVFPVVWTALFLLLGEAWVRAKGHDGDAMHAVCVLLLDGWIAGFACADRPRLGLYILACSVAVTVTCIAMHTDPVGRVALTPLLAWLLFAFLLNWDVVTKRADPIATK